MKKAFVLILLVSLMLFGVPAASAHVHGITPLFCDGIGSTNDGGNGTAGTPADAENGGPITGLIPRDVGNAPLGVGDGGFQPANNPHC